MKNIVFILLCIAQLGFSQEEFTHDVYFDTDKYIVPLTEENRLLLFINSLDTIPVEKVSIYGFTDDRGTNEYNLNLSQNRADAIKEMFSGYGIDPELITNVNGKGEILLKVLKEEEIHKIRGLNRKVEVIVTRKKVNDTDEDEVIETEETDESSQGKTTKDIEKGTIKRGDKIRLDNIYFRTNYSYITKESKSTLEELAKIMVKNENIYFTIQGHVCCTEGRRDAVDKRTRKRNLSVARAKYIYDYLKRKGVDEKRMKYIGMRRKFPLGGEPEKDRRVEILVTLVKDN